MNITPEMIYSYVESAVNTTARPVYCASRLEPVPKSFPACYIVEASHNPVRRNVTLDNDDEQLTVTYEVQIVSNLGDGAMSEAYDIMADAEVEFKRMYFIETYCNPVSNIDPSLFRLVARFTRVIGEEDTLYERGE